MLELPDLSNTWTIYVDGSKRVLGAGAGVILMSPQGDKMRYILSMRFTKSSNNEAEYEAVLHGMHWQKHVAQLASRSMVIQTSSPSRS
jgi:ribonuclease HI